MKKVLKFLIIILFLVLIASCTTKKGLKQDIQNQNDEFNKKIEELTGKIDELSNQSNISDVELLSKINLIILDYNEKINTFKEAYNSKVAELVASDEALTTALSEAEATLKTSIETLDEELTTTINTFKEEYNTKVAELVASDEATQEALAALDTELDEKIASAQNDYNEKINTFKEEYNTKVAELNEKDNEIEAAMDALNEELSTQLSGLEEDYNNKINSLKELYDDKIATIETILAEQTSIINQLTSMHQVTLVYDNGSENEVLSVKHLNLINQQITPEKEGYTFVGWFDEDEVKWNFSKDLVVKDLTLTAKWSINSYTVSFVFDDLIIYQQYGNYNEELVFPSNPSKEGYTFIGWDSDLTTIPAEDTIINAEFEINKYQIRFISEDNILFDEKLEYNSLIEYPDNPEKEGYSFTNWSQNYEYVPSFDVDFIANFNINSYVITYKVSNQEERQNPILNLDFEDCIDDIEYTNPKWEQKVFINGEWQTTAGQIRSREKNGSRVINICSGWGKIYQYSYLENETIKGVSHLSLKLGNYYNMTEANIKIALIEEDGSLFYLHGDENNYYSIPITSGMDIIIEDDFLKHDILGVTFIYQSDYHGTEFVYLDDLVLIDGTTNDIYKQEKIQYGDLIPNVSIPVREHYTFGGWDIEIPNIMPAHDIIVNGELIINSHTVTFMVKDDVFSEYVLNYGEEITYPNAPEIVGLTFVKWNLDYTFMPDEDIVIEAVFTNSEYNVKFISDRTIIFDELMVYDSIITYPDDPSKEGYTFVNWSRIIERVPAYDVTIYAVFEINKYTVKWLNFDGTVLEIDEEVPYKSIPTYDGDVPKKESTEEYTYVFNGWNPVVDEITGDIDYTATYDEHIKINKPTADDSTFIYNGVEQKYEIDENVGYTILNGTRTNAGSQLVTVQLNDGYVWHDETYDDLEYVFNIDKYALCADAIPLQEVSFNSNYRTFNNVANQQILATEYFNQAINGISLGQLFNVDSMNDGRFGFGNDSSNYETMISVVGSTYYVVISLKPEYQDNYELINNDFILKYKTCKLKEDAANYYTIEDALKIDDLGDIILETNSSYVYTTFTSLNLTINPYADEFDENSNSFNYTLSEKSLFVPFDSTATSTYTSSSASGSACSVFYIPSNVILNISNGKELNVCANVGFSTVTSVGNRGVILNDGLIICNDSAKITSMGYIIGDGRIELKDNSIALDLFSMYDWSGGTIATNIVSACFPTNTYTFHNIACETLITSNAKYQGYIYIVAGSSSVNYTLDIIGNNNSTNCIFKPTSISENNYVVKTSTNVSRNITAYMNNYSTKQMDNLKFHGDYTDSSFSISMSLFSITVNETVALPSGRQNIIIEPMSRLSLINASHVFLPGTSIIVSENAELIVGDETIPINLSMLSIENEGVNEGLKKFSTYSVSNEAAYILNNGKVEVKSNAKIGGLVLTENENAMLNISEQGNSSTYKLFNNTNSPYYVTSISKLNLYLLQSNGYISVNPIISLDNNYLGYVDNDNNFGWLSTKINIVYDVRGGNEQIANKIIDIDKNGYVISQEDLDVLPIRDHYVFSKWSIDEEGLVDAVGNNILCDTTIYAIWTPVEYNIVYIFDQLYDNTFADGTQKNSPNNPITYNIETKHSLELPTYKDYVFDGWYFNVDGVEKIYIIDGEELISTLSNTYDIVLYGKWISKEANYRLINFVNDNSDIASPSYYMVTADTFDWDNYTLPDLSTLNNDKTYSNYFIGWYSNDFLVESIDDSMFVDNELTLEAKFLSKNSLDVYYNNTLICTYYYISGESFDLPTQDELGIVLEENQVINECTLKKNEINSRTYDYYTTTSLVLQNENSLYINSVNYCKFTIDSISSANVNVILNNGGGYLVNINEGIIESVTKFSGQSKTNGAIFYVTKGSEFNARFTNTNSSTNNSLTITGTNRSTVTTSYQTYIVSSDVQIKLNAACLLPDTLVTMADGTYKEIQYLVPGDIVMVFNHETGKLDIAPVTFNEYEDEQWFNVIHLVFDNGANIGVISEHGFFDLDTMKYEYIDESNYQDFIGHRFYTIDGTSTTLINAYIEEEYTMCYSLPTYYHLNLFTEDILSMPGGIKGLFNIFEYSETLQYDQELMEQDINTYGLFTVEELEPLGVTEEMFNAYAGKYLKVALGKGILTEEYLMYLIERYGQYTE